MDKTGRGDDEPTDPDRLEWGSEKEALVAARWARKTGAKIRRHGLIRHPDLPYLVGSVDRLATMPDGAKVVLEVKTTERGHGYDIPAGKVPEYVAVQVQHYLGLTGRDLGVVAVEIAGRPPVAMNVPRDDAAIAALWELAASFWPLVELDVPPDPAVWGAKPATVARLYPQSDGSEVELPDVAHALIAEYETARATITAAEEAKDKAQAALMLLMREAGSARAGDRLLRWTNYDTERFDTKAFRAAHPELAATYLRTTTARRFTVR
jgi:predicted phage-related endonuclease